MLLDTIKELAAAIDRKDKKTAEKILRTLNRAGMDSYTALVLVKEYKKGAL